MEASVIDKYKFLTQPEFLELYQDPVRPKYFKLQISGMKCARCIGKIENLATELGPDCEIRSARVDISSGVGTFELAQPGGLPRLIAQIESLGFSARPIRFHQDLSSLRNQAMKNDLMRLGVAGFCAGNIMMFSFAIYFGVTGVLSELFSWLSLALYLPVVLYVAYPFYEGSYRSLKQKSLSIDLPIAVASLSGFIFSLANLIRGEGSIYFDSLSGFLFLILIARFFQAQLQRKFLSEQKGKSGGLQEKFLVKDEQGHEKWLPIEGLRVALTVEVKKDDVLAFDGEVLGSQCLVSLALITGESSPKFFSAGSVVPAGAKLLTSQCPFRVVKTLSSTSFGQILQSVEMGRLSKTRLMGRSDKASFYLLATVFSTAILFWALYSLVNPLAAAERSLALVILACPCAMAFGTPLALTLGLSKSAKAGLLIKNADVFEKVKNIENVFFDKTGTLTNGNLELIRAVPERVTQETRDLILSLEKQSLHPVSFAFRAAWQEISKNVFAFDHVEEIYGQGVVGRKEKENFELKKIDEGLERCVGLFINSELRQKFYFHEQLSAGASDLIRSIQKSGKKVFLMTGDNLQRAQELANLVGIEPANVFAGKSPEDKATIVSNYANSLMIGDGANDAKAFQKASVGVSVTGALQVAFEASDVYLLKDQGLARGLQQLFAVSEESVKQVNANLMVSAIYNAVGGTLALLGWVNPFVAALLMPLSSGLIVLSTFVRSQK